MSDLEIWQYIVIALFLFGAKNSRPGRNPKTGEEIPVSTRRVVTFKASRKLKDNVFESA